MPAAPKELEYLVYTIPQAAEVLHVSAPTVRMMVNRGDIPAMRIGRRTLLSKKVLDQWVLDNQNSHFDGHPRQAS